eukprot:scaffold579_cov546-Prasinococcus_capsulatus_cf.AAC.8
MPDRPGEDEHGPGAPPARDGTFQKSAIKPQIRRSRGLFGTNSAWIRPPFLRRPSPATRTLTPPLGRPSPAGNPTCGGFLHGRGTEQSSGAASRRSPDSRFQVGPHPWRLASRGQSSRSSSDRHVAHMRVVRPMGLGPVGQRGDWAVPAGKMAVRPRPATLLYNLKAWL